MQDFRAINKSAAKKGVRYLGPQPLVVSAKSHPKLRALFSLARRSSNGGFAMFCQIHKPRNVKQMNAFRRAVDIRWFVKFRCLRFS